MPLAPGWSERSSKCFQLTLEIASGFPSGLGCQFKNTVLLEIKNPQVELCRGLREGLMIDHAVSAIRDPGTGVNLCNGSGQIGNRGYSNRDAATLCPREFFN